LGQFTRPLSDFTQGEIANGGSNFTSEELVRVDMAAIEGEVFLDAEQEEAMAAGTLTEADIEAMEVLAEFFFFVPLAGGDEFAIGGAAEFLEAWGDAGRKLFLDAMTVAEVDEAGGLAADAENEEVFFHLRVKDEGKKKGRGAGLEEGGGNGGMEDLEEILTGEEGQAGATAESAVGVEGLGDAGKPRGVHGEKEVFEDGLAVGIRTGTGGGEQQRKAEVRAPGEVAEMLGVEGAGSSVVDLGNHICLDSPGGEARWMPK